MDLKLVLKQILCVLFLHWTGQHFVHGAMNENTHIVIYSALVFCDTVCTSQVLGQG